MHVLAYLQNLSVPHRMDWNLVSFVPKMAIEKLGYHEALRVSHEKGVSGLFHVAVQSKLTQGEVPQLANTFINQFIKANGDYSFEFRAKGWV